MASLEGNLNLGETARERCTLTVTLHGVRTFAARVWIGSRIIKFGAWVIGMPLVFQGKADDDVA